MLDSFEQSDDFKISIDGQSVPVEVLAEGDTVLDTADFFITRLKIQVIKRLEQSLNISTSTYHKGYTLL